MDLNRVTLIGRLTRDPEVRSTPAGRSVASVTVATGRAWTDQAGQKQKESEFHNIVMWSKLADIAGQYLRKGARLYVEGRPILTTLRYYGTLTPFVTVRLDLSKL